MSATDVAVPERIRERRAGQPSGSSFGYRPALDGIRAGAVLGVLAFHAGAHLGGGFVGVDVFFVLSGYLITTLLLREWGTRATVDLRAFYARRARRLLPALFLTIAAAGALYVVRPGLDRGAGFGWAALAATFYAANLLGIDLGVLTHTWSLALEEQFYILWPPLLLVLLRRRWSRRNLLALASLGAAAAAAVRAALWIADRDAFSLNWRCDGLLLGCALALALDFAAAAAVVRRIATPVAAPLTAIGVLFVAALLLRPSGDATFLGGLVVVAVAAAVVIAHTTCAELSLVTRTLSLRPLVWIGRRSYGIYLLHPLAFAFIAPLGISLWGRAAAGAALTFLLAAASFRCVEARFLRPRRYTRATPVAEVSLAVAD